ncbi:E3 ubiquitin-protein ligase PRT1-like isoform X2 [Phragmites australis]|uniref:E3 ubiquitin-protein ligase PRT1-like isoform X2 n=1 Tax=Phragmites australis TaxID=29695 RepID=UPI002D7754A5|nr:E3 ubiquitin-protein ligase PRT1-like isoform X2 [Phragmites australis]
MASDGHQPEPGKKVEGEAASTVAAPGCDDLEDTQFQCCVCLDLLYKPVVIACGHMSCFWCVHKAMHIVRESHCAVCRQPYKHFPSICQLLHHLILKLEPADYKRREKEVLEEEKRIETFSPQIIEFLNSKNNEIGKDGENRLEDSRTRSPQEVSSNGNIVDEHSKKIKLEDVSCPLCQEMLYQPAVLNCGHVYCVSCLSSLNEEALKCQVCGSLHPGEFPNVCLDLDHFLEEYFPAEYKSRGEKVQFKKGQRDREGSSSESSRARYDDDLSNIHIGVGCDSCGVYPIRGKRYKCQDCTELIGFDLCETCYNSSSKLPGRFNQQHTPDHRMEVDNTALLQRLLRFHGIAEEGPEELMMEDAVVAPGAMVQIVIDNLEMEGNGAEGLEGPNIEDDPVAPGTMLHIVIDNQEMEDNGEENQLL